VGHRQAVVDIQTPTASLALYLFNKHNTTSLHRYRYLKIRPQCHHSGKLKDFVGHVTVTRAAVLDSIMQSVVSNNSRTRSLRVPPAAVFKPVIASANSSAGISYIALFLANLRLLDLDLREDWPEISATTFSTKDAQQNQKRRIQSVEWALYQLFALWDPEEVQNVRAS
jgi:hypothetical protein